MGSTFCTCLCRVIVSRPHDSSQGLVTSPFGSTVQGLLHYQRGASSLTLGRLTRQTTAAPWDVSQAPYTERSLQVVLADRTFVLMPICTWNQSKRCGMLHHAKQFLLQGKSALACGLVLSISSYCTTKKRKGERAVSSPWLKPGVSTRANTDEFYECSRLDDLRPSNLLHS